MGMILRFVLDPFYWEVNVDCAVDPTVLSAEGVCSTQEVVVQMLVLPLCAETV
jgi:hypothetical protein